MRLRRRGLGFRWVQRVFGDDETLTRLLRTVLVEDSLAERLSASGVQTGAGFGRDRFSAAWERELAAVLRTSTRCEPKNRPPRPSPTRAVDR